MEKLKKENKEYKLQNDENYAKFERLTDRCNKLTVELEEAHKKVNDL